MFLHKFLNIFLHTTPAMRINKYCIYIIPNIWVTLIYESLRLYNNLFNPLIRTLRLHNYFRQCLNYCKEILVLLGLYQHTYSKLLGLYLHTYSKLLGLYQHTYSKLLGLYQHTYSKLLGLYQHTYSKLLGLYQHTYSKLLEIACPTRLLQECMHRRTYHCFLSPRGCGCKEE